MSNQNEHKAKLEMYSHAEQRIGKAITHIWENMKFTTTIVLSLITATIALLQLSWSWVVIFLPILALIITCLSFLNLKRQYYRFLEAIVWLNKIEKCLGLYKEIKEDERLFSAEKHLVSKRFFESGKYETTEDFIKAKLVRCGDTIYGHFSKVHIVYAILTLILLFIVVFLTVPKIC